MKTLLTDLYYGHLHPGEENLMKDAESKHLLHLICEHKEKLKQELPAELRTIFTKYEDCCSEYHSISDEHSFISGVRFGVRLMIEAMSSE